MRAWGLTASLEKTTVRTARKTTSITKKFRSKNNGRQAFFNVVVPTLFTSLVLSLWNIAYADYEEGMEAYRKAWDAFSAQRYEDARQLTTQAIKADPSNPHAHALAGDLAYLAHDLDGARQAWTRALSVEPRLRPLKERLQQIEQELSSEQVPGTSPTSPVSGTPPTEYPGGGEPDTGALQAAQTFLEKQLGMRLEPVPIVMLDPDIFAGSMHPPTEAAGLFDGAIRLPRQSDSHHGDSHFGHDRPGWPSLEAIVWHHMAHAAVHQLAKGRAPRWVHEGVAQLAQAQVDSIPTEALQIALRGRKVPTIEQMEGHSQELGQTMPMEAGVFYQAAWAQVASLQERLGWAGIGRFLRMLSGGMSATDAIEQLTTLQTDAWHDHWRHWLSERLESPVR